jgi:hypothetical protein
MSIVNRSLELSLEHIGEGGPASSDPQHQQANGVLLTIEDLLDAHL